MVVPLRVEAFCWLAVAVKVSTVDNLRRRGMTSINLFDICLKCGKEKESVNHLFLYWGDFIGVKSRMVLAKEYYRGGGFLVG